MSEWQVTPEGWLWRLHGFVLESAPAPNADPNYKSCCVDLRRVVGITQSSFPSGEPGTAFWLSGKDGDFFGLRVPYKDALEAWLAATGYARLN